jgi:hypothetical protein
VIILAINNVAQKEEVAMKSMWRCAGASRTQLPVDYLWSMVSPFPRLSVNSDNLPFSYVILNCYSLICHYMYENKSWHTYSYALGFLWKNRCDIDSDRYHGQEEERSIKMRAQVVNLHHNAKDFVCRISKHMERESIHQFQSIWNGGGAPTAVWNG